MRIVAFALAAALFLLGQASWNPAVSASAGSSPTASHPPHPAPPDWLEDPTSELSGIVAYYKLANSDAASNQFMSSEVYEGYASLDDLIVRNHQLLRHTRDAQIISESRITICGGEAAWLMKYTQSSPIPDDPNRVLNIDQVASVRGNSAYVSAYIRPTLGTERPEAEQWIRSNCGPGK